MIIINIIIGLIGLGLVVFVHEAGHLFAAKASGIEVEAFSIGWGKKLAGFTYRGTEYRISIVPVGGYCKMKGEESFRQAWMEKAEEIPKEPGSFYSAPPWKRIIVSLSGPGMNLLFSVIVLTFVWYIGFTIQTFGNRIVLQSDYPLGAEVQSTPASEAGLESGDRITAINGKKVETFRDIEQHIAPAAGKKLELTVRRDGRTFQTTLEPNLETETGAGKIGIYAWIDPVIGSIQEGSPAAEAGLRSGDRIISVNGSKIRHSIDFISEISNIEGQFTLTIERNGRQIEKTLSPEETENGRRRIGILFKHSEVRSPELGFLAAVGKGAAKTGETLALTIRSIALLFQGVDLRQAIAGPVRITYMVGEVASQGFRIGVGEGFTAFFNFLSLLSVALFFMNLLPIPALDGGQIVLFLVESIRGRSLKPKTIYRYQTIGMVIVFMLLGFALLNDAFFLIRG